MKLHFAVFAVEHLLTKSNNSNKFWRIILISLHSMLCYSGQKRVAHEYLDDFYEVSDFFQNANDLVHFSDDQ